MANLQTLFSRNKCQKHQVRGSELLLVVSRKRLAHQANRIKVDEDETEVDKEGIYMNNGLLYCPIKRCKVFYKAGLAYKISTHNPPNYRLPLRQVRKKRDG